MSAEVASFLDYLLAGGTGIEPAPCGFGDRLHRLCYASAQV